MKVYVPIYRDGWTVQGDNAGHPEDIVGGSYVDERDAIVRLIQMVSKYDGFSFGTFAEIRQEAIECPGDYYEDPLYFSKQIQDKDDFEREISYLVMEKGFTYALNKYGDSSYYEMKWWCEIQEYDVPDPAPAEA